MVAELFFLQKTVRDLMKTITSLYDNCLYTPYPNPSWIFPLYLFNSFFTEPFKLLPVVCLFHLHGKPSWAAPIHFSFFFFFAETLLCFPLGTSTQNAATKQYTNFMWNVQNNDFVVRVSLQVKLHFLDVFSWRLHELGKTVHCCLFCYCRKT